MNSRKQVPKSVWSYPRGNPSTGISSKSGPSSRVRRLETAIGAPEPGETLAQRFTIQERIAEGGMSLIYRAFDTTRQHPVALKFLSPALLKEPAAVKAFRNESQISIQINHPNILRVFDVQAYQDSQFLVMELLEGGTLRRWMRTHAKDSLKESGKCDILLQICKALAYAHQTTAHCDLKPENIGITDTGETKIMDFGLARLTNHYQSNRFRETVTQLNGGTPYYIAPEQLSGDTPGNPLCDQFSFGVIAYEMLTGELPIGLSRPLTDRATSLSPRFTQAIDRCLATDPHLRFPDMNGLAQELERGLAERTSGFRVLRRILKQQSGATKIVLTAAATALLLLIPANAWLKHYEFTRAQVDRGWQQLEEIQKDAADLAEIAEEKKQTLAFLRQSIATQSQITNRSPRAEIHFTNLTRDHREAEAVWSWLEPRITSEGNFASLDQMLMECRWALRSKRLADFQKRRQATTEAIEHLRTDLEAVPRIAALRLDCTRRIEEGSTLINHLDPAHQWPFLQARAISAGESGPTALQHWTELDKNIRRHLETRYQTALQSYQHQATRWTELFGLIGPPDLAFLSDPLGQGSEAIDRHSEEQWIPAIQLLDEATGTLRIWADEVERQERALEQARVPGEEYIEGLGMRFVKVGGFFWSVTEVRVMDFARWVSAESKITPTTAKRWGNPGFSLGPTDPAVWITREDAVNFAIWLGHMLVEHRRPLGTLPAREHWEAMAESGNLKDPIPFAIFPDPSQWQSEKFQNGYEDKRINPRTFLGPTDRGKPSRSGLFGLANGIWEWTDSFYDYGDKSPWPNRPLQWLLAGGGQFGIATFNDIEPPRTKNIDFVLRKDAVGIRVLLMPRF